MAITRMIQADVYAELAQAGEDVFESDYRTGFDADGNPETIHLYWHRTHHGKVLRLGERNGYHDSDFYAEVWTGYGISRVEYGTTRAWCPNHAAVDATPDVRAAAEEHKRQRDAAAYAARAARQAERAERECMERMQAPAKGRTVEVYKGRKVPVGTVGVVVWAGESRWGMRVGIKVEGVEDPYWTAADNCRAIVNKPDGMTWAEFAGREAAAANAARDAAASAAPKVGDAVALDGEAFAEGTVFWARAYPSGSVKLGVARQGAKKRGRGYHDRDVVWTWADKVRAAVAA